MELQGATFLYTLAGLMVTFAGFSALLLSLRQAAGARLGVLDRFLAKTVLVNMFTLTAGALLPNLLGLFGLSEASVWKLATLIFSPIMLLVLLSYPMRRKRVVGKAPPPIILAIFVVLGSAVIGASAIYILAGLKWCAAAYVSALVLNFFTTAFAYITALDVVMQQPIEVKPLET